MTNSSPISNMLPIPSLSFPVFSAFVILLLILVKHWSKSKASINYNNLPPGPPKLPLIGNLHQLISGSLPHYTITKLGKIYGPVMHLRLGEHFAVVISSAEAAKEVLKTKELSFAQRPEVLAVETSAQSSMVFTAYGDYWRQIRKICMLGLLSTKRVKSFAFVREEEVWNLIESICSYEGVTINLSEMISSIVSNIISRAAFNKKCKDQGEFLSLLAQAIRVAGGFTLLDLYPSLRFLRHINGVQRALDRLNKKLDKILDDIISEHKVKRKFASSNSDEVDHEDLVDVLLKHQESDQPDIHITYKDIKAVCVDMFSAGSESSAMITEWAMAELIKSPRVMEKAQAELRQVLKGKTKIKEADIQNLYYLKSVIKETLRMHPPGGVMLREAREKCEISGYEIPAKAKVLINLYALSRDPNAWIEPDCFKPERFQDSNIDYNGTNFQFMPFGAGRRICPGIAFSTANIELALAQLLYHFDWKLPNGMKPEELDMSESLGITTRKKHNLLLIPTICVRGSG